MEHHRIYNNPPLHWGYSSSSHAMHNTWVPPPSRGIKRSISESDCEDNFSETSSKDTSPKDADADSCQHLSRKKRRGVIEKKRRDRINSSLSELKRLVPSAYEKQGSSKLEKAEILQLTVDHLKTLHAKGIDSMSFDPQRYAMDYHVIGFQECVSEVARYLIAHEGMDIQNPLRMRLLSHLRCFAAQRELSIKSAAAPAPVAGVNQSWTPTPAAAAYPLTQSGYATVAVASTLAPPPPPPPAPSSSTSSLLPPRSLQTPTTSTITSSILPSASSVSSGQIATATAMYSSSYATSPHTSNYPYVPNLAPTGSSSSDLFSEPHTPTSVATGTHASNDTLSTHSAELHHHHHQHQQQQQQQHSNHHYVQHQDQNGTTYTDLSSSAQRNAVVSIGYSNQYLPNAMSGFGHHLSSSEHDSDPLSAGYNSNNKPYRPWGGPEMAY